MLPRFDNKTVNVGNGQPGGAAHRREFCALNGVLNCKWAGFPENCWELRQMNTQSQPGNREELSSHLIAQINVKLALIGCPPVAIEGDTEFVQIVSAMAQQSREKDRLLGSHLNP